MCENVLIFTVKFNILTVVKKKQGFKGLHFKDNYQVINH